MLSRLFRNSHGSPLYVLDLYFGRRLHLIYANDITRDFICSRRVYGSLELKLVEVYVSLRVSYCSNASSLLSIVE